MANAEHFVQIHRYSCHSCDGVFEEEGPRKGYYFSTSEGYRDDEGDTFFEGETKILIGIATYACHNMDGWCSLSAGDFTLIECEGFRCTTCGAEYMWDNDYCAIHPFDSGGRARCEKAASQCCTNGTSLNTSGDLSAMSSPTPPLRR